MSINQRLYLFAEISSTTTKLTISTYGGKEELKVNRDELHLYIIKATTSPSTQILTIQIKDENNNLMVSEVLHLKTTGWFTIVMNGTIHNWFFNTTRPTRSMEVKFSSAIGATVANGSQAYPSIGTSLKQPYLIVYVD